MNVFLDLLLAIFTFLSHPSLVASSQIAFFADDHCKVYDFTLTIPDNGSCTIVDRPYLSFNVTSQTRGFSFYYFYDNDYTNSTCHGTAQPLQSNLANGCTALDLNFEQIISFNPNGTNNSVVTITPSQSATSSNTPISSTLMTTTNTGTTSAVPAVSSSGSSRTHDTSEGEKIGVGVGVTLFVLLAAAVIGFILFQRRRARRNVRNEMHGDIIPLKNAGARPGFG